MIYWVREIAGWLLVLLGLAVFVQAYDYLEQRKIFEAWPMVIMGIFVFRGGVHLLKVAVAGRVCRQAQNQLYPAPPRAVAAPAAARRRVVRAGGD